jgi:hypothetical protein
MATGTGKTVVMAMLIVWQTVNKVAARNDARFAKRFWLLRRESQSKTLFACSSPLTRPTTTTNAILYL